MVDFLFKKSFRIYLSSQLQRLTQKCIEKESKKENSKPPIMRSALQESQVQMALFVKTRNPDDGFILEDFRPY